MDVRESQALKHMVVLFRRLTYTVCFLIAAGTSCTHADDNAATNKLFVEVVQMVKKAAAAHRRRRLACMSKLCRILIVS